MKHVEQLIIRHFSDDDLSVEERTRMRAHLRACEVCRDEYDLAAQLLRAGAGTGTDAEPTRGEMDSWRRGIVAALDEPAAEPEPQRGWLPGLMIRLAPVVAVAALVVVAVLVAHQQDPEEIPRVQFRGTPDGGAGTGSGTLNRRSRLVLVDLEVYAIRASADTPPVPRRLAPGDSLALDEYIQFSRICSSNDIKHLYVLGLDQWHRPLDYFPRPSALQSIATDCSTAPRAVGRSIRLSKRHAAGPLWVVALYSEKPLTRVHVHAIIARARTAGMDVTTVERLDFGAGVYPVFQRFVVTGGAK